MKAEVTVYLKPDVLDTQGRAILRGAHRLGFESIKSVRVGKTILLDMTDSDAAQAQRTVQALCEQLLSNPVIETASYELKD